MKTESPSSRTWVSVSKHCNGFSFLLLNLYSHHSVHSSSILFLAWSTRISSGNGESWDARYAELAAYRAQHGNCYVPRNYPQNQALSNWVANQRCHYKIFMKNLKSPQQSQEYTFMTQARIDALEKIGMVWSLRKRGPKDSNGQHAAAAGNQGEETPSFKALTVAAAINEAEETQSSPAVERSTALVWEL